MIGMEASMAAQGDGQADGQGEQSAGLHAVPAGADVSALVEQFGQMQQGQEEMRAILSGLAEGDYAFPESGADDLDAVGLEQAGADPGDVFGPDGDPAADAEQLAGHLEAVMQHHTEQAVGPLRETVSDLQRTMDITNLVHELPELADPQVMSDVLDQARIVVESEGLPLELAARPAFVRLVYAAGLAFAQAAAESDGEEPERAAHLEGGGGAGPSGGGGVSAAQSIVGATSHKSVLPF